MKIRTGDLSHCVSVVYGIIWVALPRPGASRVAQMVTNLPVMQATWVQSLSQEDPLEKRMATHSSILAWRIPWTEGPGRLQFMGFQLSLVTTEQLTLSIFQGY